MSDREIEVVVWGASGFTGRLTAEYLLGRHGASGSLRWAIGGRNRTKLEQIRDDLARETGASADALEIIVGDGDDEPFLAQLTRRCRVVCTTVGPYSRYGSKLVAACASAGTSYCDLTGEVHWMRRMIGAHQDEAVASGARIVFTCGFDCIPFDLGVFFLQREMKTRHGTVCSRIQTRVKAMRGGASGGTLASALDILDASARDPIAARAMAEPYSLNPKDQQTGPDTADRSGARYDADFQEWTAPFVMAPVNTKVVRRSNALLGYAYGRDFRYDEATLMGAGPVGFVRAAATSAGSAAVQGAMSVAALRRAAARRLPQPGQGPSRERREAGYFDLLLRGTSNDGHVIRGRVRGDRDPGYGSTSKMLAESAVCLAQDELSVGGGLWTPASAMGEALLARLPRAGVTFRIEDASAEVAAGARR